MSADSTALASSTGNPTRVEQRCQRVAEALGVGKGRKGRRRTDIEERDVGAVAIPRELPGGHTLGPFGSSAHTITCRVRAMRRAHQRS